MSRVIVIQFISLDGVTQDPDGSDGERLFGDARPTDLHLVSAETRGPAALLTYSRPCR